MEEFQLIFGDQVQTLPVTLNVCDSSIRLLGLGLYHTSVQVDEQEFMFLPTGEDHVSGIVTPNVQGLMLCRTILIGYTTTGRLESAIFGLMLGLYHGSSYDLVTNNCNHFSKHLCRILTGNWIPAWVNRISLFGCLCSCIMPENELNAELVGMVPPNPSPNGGRTDDVHSEDGEDEDIEEEEEGDEEPEGGEDEDIEGGIEEPEEEGEIEGDEQEQEQEQGVGEEKEEEEEEDNE